MVDDDTPRAVADPRFESTPTQATVTPDSGEGPIDLPAAGYSLGDTIGRGGMGEVVAVIDARIGREVALKRISAPSPSRSATARFLREARIQARLEHPAIVPVHELGVDIEGRAYFTMKRLVGVTLATKLAKAGAQKPLLRAFVEVCRAIAFAHARGVIHLDLKPANLMLGDFDEVYVLDWGIAHETTEAKAGIGVVGTPGYIAPERLRDGIVGPAADVYALGAILFEILAGEPLHPRGDGAVDHTLRWPQDSPGVRKPELGIPPELDAVVHDALEPDPDARPSATTLADRVQSYLDGDRDLERRRELAAQLLAEARALVLDDRATAMRVAGRALALDPTSEPIAELVSSLILSPPAELPAELVASLDDAERAVAKNRSRRAIGAFLSLFVFWAVIPFVHVTNWTTLIAFYGLVGLAAMVSWRSYRTGRTPVVAALVVNLVLAISFSRIASVFMLTPVVISVALMALASINWVGKRPWVIVAWATTALVLPIALEWLGVFGSTWSIGERGITTSSTVFGGHAAIAVLLPANIVIIVIGALLASGLHRQRGEAQRQLHIQAWHLRQLLPDLER